MVERWMLGGREGGEDECWLRQGGIIFFVLKKRPQARARGICVGEGGGHACVWLPGKSWWRGVACVCVVGGQTKEAGARRPMDDDDACCCCSRL